MSQKHSDSEQYSSSKTKPILKMGSGQKLTTKSSSLNMKRNNTEDSQNKHKRVLIIKCKASKDNEKAVSLFIEGSPEQSKSCSINTKETVEKESLDVKKKSVDSVEDVKNKAKKKQLKLKFVDEVDSFTNAEVTDVVPTAEEKSDESIQQIFLVEKKKSAHNYVPKPSVEQIVNYQTSETTFATSKIDVASAVKENIMYRRINKSSLGDTSELTKLNPVTLELSTTTDDNASSMSKRSSLPLSSENYFNESSAEMSMDTEEIETEDVSTADFLTPELFHSMYLKTLEGYPSIRGTNDFLHKKMTQYFTKRHMNSALIECENPLENYNKYIKFLKQLDKLVMEDTSRREIIKDEIKILEESHTQLGENAKNDFIAFQKRETEIGSGLIFSKSNKTLPENAVKNLVNTQRKKMEELHQMRVTHIKLRNAIATKNAKLKELEKLGGNLTRREFDELKTLNRSLMDKIEEREIDLAKLRKCNTFATTQLAHYREKISSTEVEFHEIVKRCTKADAELLKVRINLNKIHMLRDKCRKKTLKMREDSGLLVKDKLLVDMERCINDVKRMEEELVAANLKYQKMSQRAKCLKYNYNKECARAVILSKQLP